MGVHLRPFRLDTNISSKEYEKETCRLQHVQRTTEYLPINIQCIHIIEGGSRMDRVTGCDNKFSSSGWWNGNFVRIQNMSVKFRSNKWMLSMRLDKNFTSAILIKPVISGLIEHKHDPKSPYALVFFSHKVVLWPIYRRPHL